MATPSTDQQEQSVVVGVIRDLTHRLEEYEQRADTKREIFQETIMANFVDFRNTMNRAIIPMQVDHQDHRRTHDADRTERSNRQTETDRRFGALHDDLRRLQFLLVGVIALMAIAVGLLAARFL